LLIFVSCGQPLRSRVLTKENEMALLQAVGQSSAFTAEERERLARIVMAAKMGEAFGQHDHTIYGRTLGDLLDEAERQEAQAAERRAAEERLAEELRAKNAAVQAKLLDALAVVVLSKEDAEYAFMRAIEVRCGIKNTSGQEIRAFKGRLAAFDQFGEEIGSTLLESYAPLGAGQDRTIKERMIDGFGTSLKKLREIPFQDVKWEWRPASVAFADGSVLQLEE